MESPALKTANLEVRLGGKVIVSDISMSVGRGEVVALLGANGSGKSTIVKASLGLIAHSLGSVEILGEDSAHTPWDRVGYVPQRMPATTGVPTTALEVVRAGALSRRNWRRANKAAAMEALAAMGMADRARQPVQEMSGGQQQRVLISRALVRRPDLLILDEPTTGIDIDTIDTFVTTIAAMRSSGTAVLVVLHETEAFASLLDRAVVLRHGKIIHDGTPPPAHPGHSGPEHEHSHPHPEPLPEPPLGLTVLGADE